jgi:CRP-like cAMP-binding protein
MADRIALFRGEKNRRRLAAGEVVFSAGDEADGMVAVIEGAIEIVVDGAVVETVEAGSVLGEVAVLGDLVRTATARAARDSEIAIVDQDAFLRMVKTNPFFAIEVMRLLAARLSRVSTDRAD